MALFHYKHSELSLKIPLDTNIIRVKSCSWSHEQKAIGSRAKLGVLIYADPCDGLDFRHGHTLNCTPLNKYRMNVYLANALTVHVYPRMNVYLANALTVHVYPYFPWGR